MKQLAKVFVMCCALVLVGVGCSKREPEKGLLESLEDEFRTESFSVGPHVIAARKVPFTHAIPLYSQALAANDKCIELVHFLSVVKAVEFGNFAEVSSHAMALILKEPDNVEYAAIQVLSLQKDGDDAGARIVAEKFIGQDGMTDYEAEILRIASISNYNPSAENRFTKRQLEFIQMLVRYKSSGHGDRTQMN